jgi:colanic acid/amylovoran biosynthesis glycosyltransferase
MTTASMTAQRVPLGPSDRNLVAIYRDQVFKPSETFLPLQGEALSRYRSIYVCMRFTPTVGISRDRVVALNGGGNLGHAREIAFKSLGVSGRLVRDLRALRPSLLHAHTGQDGAVMLPVARRLPVPLIVTFHGYDATATDDVLRRAERRSRVFLRRREALKREGRLFIAVSEFIREELLSQGYPESKVVVHYVGVDTDFFRPIADVARQPIVLFAGRLIEVKGAAHLIRAMREVQARLPEAELVIAGRGWSRQRYEQLANELGVRTRFLGLIPPEELRAWMNRARVFCMPSIVASTGQREAFGMVFAEAQAMGLPVASFATGGIPEAVAHGQTGLLAREGDIAALAANIESLLTDETLWNRMSLAGMARVRERFDLRCQTAKLESLYDAVRVGAS